MMVLQRLLGKSSSEPASSADLPKPTPTQDTLPKDDLMDTESDYPYLSGQPSLNDIDEDNNTEEASSPHSLDSLPNKRMKIGESGAYVSIGGAKDNTSTTSTTGGSNSQDESVLEGTSRPPPTGIQPTSTENGDNSRRNNIGDHSDDIELIDDEDDADDDDDDDDDDKSISMSASTAHSTIAGRQGSVAEADVVSIVDDEASVISGVPALGNDVPRLASANDSSIAFPGDDEARTTFPPSDIPSIAFEGALAVDASTKASIGADVPAAAPPKGRSRGKTGRNRRGGTAGPSGSSKRGSHKKRNEPVETEEQRVARLIIEKKREIEQVRGYIQVIKDLNKLVREDGGDNLTMLSAVFSAIDDVYDEIASEVILEVYKKVATDDIDLFKDVAYTIPMNVDIDIFGQDFSSYTPEAFLCDQGCGRLITAGRYAPHLEKCSNLATARVGSGRRTRAYEVNYEEPPDQVDDGGDEPSAGSRRSKNAKRSAPNSSSSVQPFSSGPFPPPSGAPVQPSPQPRPVPDALFQNQPFLSSTHQRAPSLPQSSARQATSQPLPQPPQQQQLLQRIQPGHGSSSIVMRVNNSSNSLLNGQQQGQVSRQVPQRAPPDASHQLQIQQQQSLISKASTSNSDQALPKASPGPHPPASTRIGAGAVGSLAGGMINVNVVSAGQPSNPPQPTPSGPVPSLTPQQLALYHQLRQLHVASLNGASQVQLTAQQQHVLKQLHTQHRMATAQHSGQPPPNTTQSLQAQPSNLQQLPSAQHQHSQLPQQQSLQQQQQQQPQQQHQQLQQLQLQQQRLRAQQIQGHQQQQMPALPVQPQHAQSQPSQQQPVTHLLNQPRQEQVAQASSSRWASSQDSPVSSTGKGQPLIAASNQHGNIASVQVPTVRFSTVPSRTSLKAGPSAPLSHTVRSETQHQPALHERDPHLHSQQQQYHQSHLQTGGHAQVPAASRVSPSPSPQRPAATSLPTMMPQTVRQHQILQQQQMQLEQQQRAQELSDKIIADLSPERRRIKDLLVSLHGEGIWPYIETQLQRPLEDRVRSLSKKCGVISLKTSKMCTKSLKCPQHDDWSRYQFRILILGDEAAQAFHPDELAKKRAVGGGLSGADAGDNDVDD